MFLRFKHKQKIAISENKIKIVFKKTQTVITVTSSRKHSEIGNVNTSYATTTENGLLTYFLIIRNESSVGSSWPTGLVC